jgi:hypothetical protein
MADAIPLCDGIDRQRCRATARQGFSLDAMIASYFRVYQRLAAAAPRFVATRSVQRPR